jgi:zinc protease
MNSARLQRRPAPWVALVCLLALAAPAAVLAQAPAAPKKVVTIEGITEYQLDNGLRVLLFPDEGTPNVTVNLTVFVGSRHEGYGETGMAHLLEHMVFKGTPTHKDVPKALKDHGAQFNGTTWVDRTNYFETMTGTEANLEFGLKLEADRMVNSLFSADKAREDLAKEMTVVRSEFEQGENIPSNVLSQRMMKAAYEWHNYGKSTIGNRSDIERVPIERLQGFYKKYYRPDNAMLVVAGNFKTDKALELIGKHFGVLKKPAAQLDKTYTEEPAQDGERHVTLRRVGKVGVVGVIYHIPAGAHADFAAVEMLNHILVSEPSGRLYKALVPTKKATSVSGVAFNWHDPAVLEVSAEVDPGSTVEDVRDTMTGLLEKLADTKFTAEEVDRAKNNFKRNRDQLMTQSGRIGITLSDWGAKGDWRLFFLHRDRVAKVTPEDVSRVAARYLQRNNRTLGVFIPTAKSERITIPETPLVADLVKDYKGTETVTAGETIDPTPDNLEKRMKRAELASGVKVALLPKKTRGEAVVLRLTLRFGNEKSLQGMRMPCELLGDILERGTKKHTRQQLQDDLAKLGARLSVGSDLGQLSVTVVTKKASLPAVLDLVREVLREPSFPAEEFDILKREQETALQKQLTEPRELAFLALQRKLNPYPKNDIRYTPTIEENLTELKATTLEQVRKLYTEQLSGKAGELVVVGEFEEGTPAKLVGEYLKDWTSTVAYERIAKPAKTDIKGGREQILTPDKANAVYSCGHRIAMTDADPDYPALLIADYLFGGGTLSSRLGNRVRQKEGLSYGIRSSFRADSKDKAAQFGVAAICNPLNMEKVDKAIMEELEKLLKDGVTAEELAEAKKAFLAQLKVQRANDSFLAMQLGHDANNGRTFARHAELEKKISDLTLEAVNAAVRKHWEPKKLVIIQAGDFNKKKEPEPKK